MSLTLTCEPEEVVSRLRDDISKRSRHVTLADISRDAGVSQYWLAKFMNGMIVDPAFTKLCKLHRSFYSADKQA